MATQKLSTQVVVVGAGAAGLLAATACREKGLDVVVVEASGAVGGATALGAGLVWLPGHPFGGRGASPDKTDDVAAYLEGVLGPAAGASSAERRAAFVATTAEVGAWLQRHRVTLYPVKNRPDVHPSAPGWREYGRVLTSGPWDRRMLGDWAERLGTRPRRLGIAPRSPRAVLAAAGALAKRVLGPGADHVQEGTGLVAQLLRAALRAGVEIWLDTPMTEILAEDGRAVGVRITRDGVESELHAGVAVILACGGFEANPELRREHLPLPTDPAWTMGHPHNTGAGMEAAARLGAPLVALDDAWWTFVARFDGATYDMTAERSLPGSIIVDATGGRFVNEAGPVPEVAAHVHRRNRKARAVPSWLILDHAHRLRYPLGPWLPGSTPNRGESAPARSDSLTELAAAINVDAAGLVSTVVRFNQQATKGSDPDFGRGDSSTDRAYGDPAHRPNPNLGALTRGPYWAVPLFPGDTGTKGGVTVDAAGRVLGGDGKPVVTRLFATTGTAASLFPGTSPAPGAALASALVDAYRAAATIARADWE